MATCFFVVFGLPSIFGLAPSEIFSYVTGISVPTATLTEAEADVDAAGNNSVPVNVSVNTLEDAADDLTASGVDVIHVSDIEDFGDRGIVLLEYSVFKEVAVEKRTALMYDLPDYSLLIIPDNGIFMVWMPEDVYESDPDDFEDFERLTISSVSSRYNKLSSSWAVSVDIKNLGQCDVQISSLMLDDETCETQNYGLSGAPVKDWGVSFDKSGIVVERGCYSSVHVYVDRMYGYSSGKVVEVTLVSSSGMEYRIPVELW